MPYEDLTVLVIEDNEFTANLLRKCLAYVGFSDILLNHSPVMALDTYASRKIDLILCDFEVFAQVPRRGYAANGNGV
ncbi:MAG: response regulator, partial [Rhodospirillaceae bacterium]